MRRVSVALVACLLGHGGNAAAAGGLTVETGSPDALCPVLDQARAAVGRRLGAVELEGHGDWKARYTIGHAPQRSPRDFVRLELLDSEGAVRLSRDLPIEGESCETMAEVIALVLDRYFRGLAHQDQRPPPLRAQPQPAKPAPGARPGGPRDSTARRSRTGYLAILGDLSLAAEPANAAFGLRALGTLGSSWYWTGALQASLLRETERLPPGGGVYAEAAHGRGGVGWRRDFGPFAGWIGPELWLSLQDARAEGLPVKHRTARVIWRAGLMGGWLVQFRQRFVLLASAGLNWWLPDLSGHLNVDRQEVLVPPDRAVWCGLGVGYVFSR